MLSKRLIEDSIETANFKSYVLPCYTDIIYLQYIKNLLLQNIFDSRFLEFFQKKNFSLLTAYLLLLHNTIVLEICKITQVPKKDDDITLLSCIKESKNIKVINSIHNKYKRLRNKKIGHLTTIKFNVNKIYEKKNNKLIMYNIHSDLFPFNKIDKDIEKLGNIIKTYVAGKNIEIISMQHIMEQQYQDFPYITLDEVYFKKLFYPLIDQDDAYLSRNNK